MQKEVKKAFHRALVQRFRCRFLLHASFLEVERGAVGFLGGPGQGKSTMAAAFLDRGFPLLSDDIGVLKKRRERFWIQPGPAEIRLRPRVATRLNRRGMKPEPFCAELKRRFHLGPRTPWRCAQSTVPLKALYLLSRRPNVNVAARSLKGQEAFLGIMRSVYVPTLQGVDLQQFQFQTAMELIEKVPIKQLVYPTDLGALPRVRRRILEDLATLSGNGHPSHR